VFFFCPFFSPFSASEKTFLPSDCVFGQCDETGPLSVFSVNCLCFGSMCRDWRIQVRVCQILCRIRGAGPRMDTNTHTTSSTRCGCDIWWMVVT
jgi:hypothetical protein